MRKYKEKGVRDLCHAVKDNDITAIYKMAEHFAETGILNSDSVIIPAPGHKGIAVYTKTIAETVSQMTGARVEDILRCCPHEKLYIQKIRGYAEKPRIFLSGRIPERGRLFFLDNVYDTGMTFKAASMLFGGRLMPLIYAET